MMSMEDEKVLVNEIYRHRVTQHHVVIDYTDNGSVGAKCLRMIL
jgi:hypothetical protein